MDSSTTGFVDTQIQQYEYLKAGICSLARMQSPFSGQYFGKIWSVTRNLNEASHAHDKKNTKSDIFRSTISHCVSYRQLCTRSVISAHTPYLTFISALWLHLRESCWSCATFLPQFDFTAMVSVCALTPRLRHMPDYEHPVRNLKVVLVRHWS